MLVANDLPRVRLAISAQRGITMYSHHRQWAVALVLFSEGKVYNQVSTPSFRGSSGGGVYVKADGRLIGLLVRSAPGGFSLIVPVRRMETWAKKTKVERSIRDDVPVPSEEELKKLPIEEDSPSR